jgi:hypothetical protein
LQNRGLACRKSPVSLNIIVVVVRSDFAHVSGGRTFGALLDGEFDFITFAQAPEALSLNCGLVDKYVLAAFDGEKAKALAVVKPLDGAGDTLLTHVGKLLVLLELQTYRAKRHVSNREQKETA